MVVGTVHTKATGFEPALGPKETICPFKAFGRKGTNENNWGTPT